MLSLHEGGGGTVERIGPKKGSGKPYMVIVFDIETGPAPDDVIERHMPEFEAPANYKDPEKIARVLDEKRAVFKERAALSPLTGEVLAVGAWIDGSYQSAIRGIGGYETEADVLEWFWAQVHEQSILIGFNSNRFDLPFLFKRSWACGIPHAPRLKPDGRLHTSSCWDLMETWQCGDRQSYISLDATARFLGVGAKTGDGEFFHQVLKAFPEEAEAYLRNDVELTFKVAQRMGILRPGLAFDGGDMETAPQPENESETEDY